MLENRHIIVFGEDFNRHPHCLEHLARQLLPQNKILWVETIGMRSPKLSLYDLKRAFQKIKGWFAPEKPNEETLPANLSRLSPFMIPYNQFGLVRRLNQIMVVRRIRTAMRELNFSAPLLITSIPSTCDFIGVLGETLSIYYCVDEFSLWPGINPNVVGPMERALIAKVDLVLTTSTALFQTKSRQHPRTELLTHGVDVGHFHLSGNPENGQIGFFGLIDERVDQDLILNLSKQLPNNEIHFIGEVVVDISRLQGQKNIIWHGKVSYADLPNAIQGFSVFILPYHLNELTRYINPLKIKEYLATGRPVVTTNLEELRRFEDVIAVAKDVEGFYREVAKALGENQIRRGERLASHLQGETWMDKAETLSSRIHLLEAR